MRIIIDSSGWIEYFSNSHLAGEYAKFIERADKSNCFVPTVVIYEVYKKVKREKGESEATDAIAQITGHGTVVELSESLALEAADRSLAENLPFADAIVRATAAKFNAEIVTGDAHFKKLDGVKYIGK